MTPNTEDAIFKSIGDILHEIGRLSGTIETEQQATRDQLNTLSNKASLIESEGCVQGRQRDERLTVLERKVFYILLVVASIVGIDKVINVFV